jgi:predicted O-linked N-acetylglucosamine transferase (SPINDLY family)
MGGKMLNIGIDNATNLQRPGSLLEAEATCRERLARNPDSANAHVELAATLNRLGRPAEAIPLLLRALRLKADLPQLHYHLGSALELLGRTGEAVAAYQNAVGRLPEHIDARLALAALFRRMYRIEEALVEYQRIVELHPGSIVAYRGLSDAYGELGEAGQAIDALQTATQLAPDLPELQSDLLFALLYSDRASLDDIRHRASAWGNAQMEAKSSMQGHSETDDPGRRLRVAYLSPDFRSHTVAHLIEPVLQAHDRGQFEVFCYSAVKKPDCVTGRMRQLADNWRDVAGASDCTVASLIAQDRIDILVDLAGHMGGSRLAALTLRPAPIQVQLAYANTTGLPAVQYRLTDSLSDPASADGYYTEQLVRLPHCAWLYRPSADAPTVGPQPSHANGYVTFGCLNNPRKLTDRVIEVWSMILRAVEASRLLVLSPTPNSRLVARFARQGIGSDRIILAPRRSRRQYLEQFNGIDIALDPFPYNGDTTTCDGFWMGVPLVTLAGNAFVSRRGVSHLSNVGLSDLIAHTPAAYVNIAAGLARDPQRVELLRLSLRDRMRRCSLTDESGYTAALESEYRRMWALRCRSER